MEINGKKHILLHFPASQYDPSFRIKTIIAHYDRVPDSQGANDNSFAVFVLMKYAEKLINTKNSVHNVRIIFTDGEESSAGVQGQGAFDLAAIFKKLNITNDDIFVFDCMGRGDTPVLSESGNLNSAPEDFRNKLKRLENTTAKILSSSSDKWLTLPSSYSDNAGFLACGIPAVTITMLPSKEAENYMKLLMKTRAKKIEDLYKPEHKTDFMNLFPLTWLYINSSRDKKETLTPESQGIFEKILENIALQKTLV